MLKLNSKQLRKTKPADWKNKKIRRNPIFFILDNVLDTYNIGSIFRLADAVAAEKIYICGSSEYPPSSRIHKAAVGTQEWVAWEKRDTAVDVVLELQKRGIQVVSVEQDDRSIDYTNLNQEIKFPVAFVVGHETNGVSVSVKNASDLIVEIPLFGINKSINVWGSLAIITYKAIEALRNNNFRK